MRASGRLRPASPLDLVDDAELRRLVTAGLQGAGGAARIRSLQRRPSPYASSSPAEIVHVRFENRPDLRLLAKYEQPGSRSGYGPRGGVAYEAAVYEHILSSMAMETVAFYGLHATATSLGECLLLEHYGDGVRLVEAPQCESAMLAAAEWIGRFHRRAKEALPRLQTGAMKFYGREYYTRWPERVIGFLAEADGDRSWLARLCESAIDLLPGLVDEQATVIHGEYYPNNVVVRHDAAVVPVDWETAAVAAGEIDVVTLTEGWPPELAHRCEGAYARARWPGDPQAGYRRRLALARLYVELRWLGDSAEYFRHGARRIERLRLLAPEFGVA